jgi:fatty acid amide hydrolase 2
MNPLLTCSGSRLARMIRSGEVSSLDVVEAHIARIEEVNPVLNALVKTRFDEARAEAREADRMLRTLGPEGLAPFHGVPCTVKECFSLTGMPCTGGLKSRRNFIARSDATAAARMRKAGAIPLGVTNVSELCLWMEADNRVYGRTNNPYDPARTAGGSSGGEGAVIGAGGSPFGLGSDIGGSIRMPAFFNGVFGHKPTAGLIPNTGQFPTSGNLPFRLLTTGPLARRGEDLWPLVRIMAGPDGRDPSCLEMRLGEPHEVRLEKLRVFVVEDNGVMDVHRDLRKVLRRAAGRLDDMGARVQQLRLDELRHSFDIWSSMLSSGEAQSMKGLMGGAGGAINPLLELFKWTLGLSDHTFPALGLALLEYFPRMVPWRTRRYVELGLDLRRKLTDLLGRDGVMLYPPYVSPAPLHRKPMFPPFNWIYTAIFNAMEVPVTQVPMGLNSGGLPVGVQAAAAHGRDHLAVAVALELENAFGGWQPPVPA